MEDIPLTPEALIDGHDLLDPICSALTARLREGAPLEEQPEVPRTVWLALGADGELRNGGPAQLLYNLRGPGRRLESALAALEGIGAAEAAAIIRSWLEEIGAEGREHILNQGPFDLPPQLAEPSRAVSGSLLALSPSVRVRLGRWLDERLDDPGLRALLDSGEVDLPDPDLSGQLVEACFECDRQRVEALLERGADPNAPGPSGDRPLHALVSYVTEPEARAELIGVLVATGADPDARDELGRAPLHLLLELPALRALLELGADPDVRDADGGTPLHRQAERALSSFEEARFAALLDAGADPSLRDGDGRDLWWFVRGHAEAYRWLSGRGLQPGVEEGEDGLHGLTTLHRAAWMDWTEGTEALLEAGHPPNVRLREPWGIGQAFAGATPLDVALRHDREGIAELLRGAGGVSGERVSWALLLRGRGEQSPAVAAVLARREGEARDGEALIELLEGAPREAGSWYEDGRARTPIIAAEGLDREEAEALSERFNALGATAEPL